MWYFVYINFFTCRCTLHSTVHVDLFNLSLYIIWGKASPCISQPPSFRVTVPRTLVVIYLEFNSLLVPSNSLSEIYLSGLYNSAHFVWNINYYKRPAFIICLAMINEWTGIWSKNYAWGTKNNSIYPGHHIQLHQPFDWGRPVNRPSSFSRCR